MSFASLYLRELRRLVLSRMVWIVTALSLCGPLLGYAFYTPVIDVTANGKYIANPVLAGALVSALLWALLMLLESDRISRAKADVLVDAAVSPIRMAVVRLLALQTLAATAVLLCALVYLPYTMRGVGLLFDGVLYARSYLILMLPTVWISILLAAAVHQIARRVELAVLLYAGIVYISVSRIAANSFFARWINPLFVDYAFSDGFTNEHTFRIAVYTRLLWLALSAGLFVLSLLCVRRYQKGLMGSFLVGLRKAYLLPFAAVLLCGGGLLWVFQPFVNHGPYEYMYDIYDSMGNGAYASKASFDITAKPNGIVSGTLTYYVTKLTDDGTPDFISFDPGYAIKSITCDGEEIPFKMLNNDVNDHRDTEFVLPARGGMTVVIEYAGMPKLLRCFSPGSWHNISAPEYVSLSNSSSVPGHASFRLPRSASLTLTIDESLTPILDHNRLTRSTDNGDGTKTWEAACDGWGFWMTACEYNSREFQAAGVTVQFMYSKKYEKSIEANNVEQAITDVMDFCSAHFGPLRFTNYGRLMMVQRGGNGGGNAGAGWVEWDEPIFSDMNLNDPYRGGSAQEVFAHELIHEWWGGLGVYSGYEGIWSDEGLTVYSTYRLMKEKYGALYAKQNYIDVWQAAIDAQNRGYYYRYPEMLDVLPEQYQAELKAGENQINQYCRMPMMILKAEQLIGGEEAMDAILRNAQAEFATRPDKFDNPYTFQQFLDACGLSEEDLRLE